MANIEPESVKNNSSSITKPVITVEAIFERLGGFSWFQLWATFIIVAPELSASMISLSPVLTGSLHLSSNDTTSEKNSTMFPVVFRTVVEEWDLNEETGRAWISDLFISLQMLGALFGSVIAGQLAERYGRRATHFGLCFSMGLFGFASGWAPDPYIFCVLRFLSGFSVGGCYVVYLNYLMEFLTPSYRTLCGCVSLWAVGEMLLALVGFLFHGWRQILWCSSAPAFLILIAYPWFPESPRYLLCHGRTEEALKVFDQIARWNGKPRLDPSDLKVLQREILKKSSKYAESTGMSTPSISTEASIEKTSTCATISSSVLSSFKVLSYREYRFQLLVLMFCWFASQLIYYGISFNMKNLTGDAYLNVLYMGIVGLPGSFTGLLFNNRLGRRTTIIGFSTISFCILIALIAIDETNLSKQHSGLILLLCLSVRLFVAAGFAVLSCLTSELFPTIIRVRCMGLCALFGNIGAILSPQFVFISTIVESAQYITFGILSLGTVVAAFNLKEMTGKPLEDFLKQNDKISQPAEFPVLHGKKKYSAISI